MQRAPHPPVGAWQRPAGAALAVQASFHGLVGALLLAAGPSLAAMAATIYGGPGRVPTAVWQGFTVAWLVPSIGLAWVGLWWLVGGYFRDGRQVTIRAGLFWLEMRTFYLGSHFVHRSIFGRLLGYGDVRGQADGRRYYLAATREWAAVDALARSSGPRADTGHPTRRSRRSQPRLSTQPLREVIQTVIFAEVFIIIPLTLGVWLFPEQIFDVLHAAARLAALFYRPSA